MHSLCCGSRIVYAKQKFWYCWPVEEGIGQKSRIEKIEVDNICEEVKWYSKFKSIHFVHIALPPSYALLGTMPPPPFGLLPFGPPRPLTGSPKSGFVSNKISLFLCGGATGLRFMGIGGPKPPGPFWGCHRGLTPRWETEVKFERSDSAGLRAPSCRSS